MVGVPWNIRLSAKNGRDETNTSSTEISFLAGFGEIEPQVCVTSKKQNFLPRGLEPRYPAWTPSVITIYIIMAKLLFHPGDSNLGITRERWLRWPPTSWQTGPHKISNLCVSFYVRYNTYHTASAPYKKIEHRGVVHTEREIFKNDIFPKGGQNNASSSQNDCGGSRSFTRDETRSTSLA